MRFQTNRRWCFAWSAPDLHHIPAQFLPSQAQFHFHRDLRVLVQHLPQAIPFGFFLFLCSILLFLIETRFAVVNYKHYPLALQLHMGLVLSRITHRHLQDVPHHLSHISDICKPFSSPLSIQLKLCKHYNSPCL